MSEKEYVLFPLPPDQNPLVQAHPSGVYVLCEMKGEALEINERLNEAKKNDDNFLLEGCWLYIANIRLAKMVHPEDMNAPENKKRIMEVYQHAKCIVLPLTQNDSSNGQVWSLPLKHTSWIFLRGRIVEEVEAELKRIKQSLSEMEAATSRIVQPHLRLSVDPNKLRNN